MAIRFGQDRIEKAPGLIAITRFLVKAAIRTHLRAEWNVDVEVCDHSAGILR